VSQIEVHVVGAFGAWASAWDDIADRMPVPSPFLRSWWIENVMVGEPTIALVTTGGQLVGGVALERRRGWVEHLRLAGSTHLASDHLDAVVDLPGRSLVVSELASWFSRAGNRVVELSGLAASSALAEALGPGSSPRVIAAAPWARLPSSYDEYLAARPPVLRNSIERAARRLARAGVEYRVVARSDVDAALVSLERLHRLRFGSDSAFLPAFEIFARAATAGVARGELAFHELTVDGEQIATEVWFEVGHTASFYQCGRDPDPRWKGSGNLLKARVIERLCGRGFTQIDLLRTDEPYKHSWVDQTRELFAVDWATGFAGRSSRALLAARRRGTDLGRSARLTLNNAARRARPGHRS
jgi:CelD/BcsL family acetyltransferase involved in cellulose biosynthesis